MDKQQKIGGLLSIVLLCVGIAMTAKHLYAQNHEPTYGITTRASVGTNGAQNTSGIYSSVVSANGAWVLFSAYSGLLVPNDTNRESDLFLHNVANGTLERISIREDGSQMDGASYGAGMSADGQWVVFESYGKVEPGDGTWEHQQIVLRHQATGALQVISHTPTGELANENCWLTTHPLSDDGEWVVFHCDATNLVEGDTNDVTDVFLYHRAADSLTRLSIGPNGEGNDRSGGATISGDGQYVSFASVATNLVPGDVNGMEDVFVVDRIANSTTLISRSSQGAQGNGISKFPIISAEGRYVTFISNATNLDSLATDGRWYLYRHDRATGETAVASRDHTGAVVATIEEAGLLSADGRWVLFATAEAAVVGDTNEVSDIFRRDMVSALVERVSVNTYNREANGSNVSATLSRDGMTLAWSSFATNLVPGDTNERGDIFVRREVASPPPRPHEQYMPLAATGRFVKWETGATRITGDANGDSTGASVDQYGERVVFESNASNLIPNDTNGVTDVFVWQRRENEFRRLSVATDGTEANGGSGSAEISSNGRYVVFVSHADNLVPNDTNQREDIFRHDLQTGETVLVSVGLEGVSANSGSNAPDLSADGRWIVFTSDATNLTTTLYPTDCTPGPCRTLYRRDMETGVTETVVKNTDGTAAVPLTDPSISNDGQRVAFGWEQEALQPCYGPTVYETFIYRFDALASTNQLISSAEGIENCLLPSRVYIWQDAPKLAGNGEYVGFYRHQYSSSQYGGSELKGIWVDGEPTVPSGYSLSRYWSMNCSRVVSALGGSGITDMALAENGKINVYAAEDLNIYDEDPFCPTNSYPHFPDDDNGMKDVYLSIAYPTVAFPNGKNLRVSANETGGVGDGESYDVALADDGFTVAYTTIASNVAPGDNNGGIRDIVVWSWR